MWWWYRHCSILYTYDSSKSWMRSGWWMREMWNYILRQAGIYFQTYHIGCFWSMGLSNTPKHICIQQAAEEQRCLLLGKIWTPASPDECITRILDWKWQENLCIVLTFLPSFQSFAHVEISTHTGWTCSFWNAHIGIAESVKYAWATDIPLVCAPTWIAPDCKQSGKPLDLQNSMRWSQNAWIYTSSF